MLIAFQKIMKKYVIPSLLSMSLFLVSVMALILSIPEKVQAAATYYNYGDIIYSYNSYQYGFYITSDPTTGLPQDYKISSDVLEDIIRSDAKGFNLQISNSYESGVPIVDWSARGAEYYINGVFGLVTNAVIALNSFAHDFIWNNIDTYSWNYHFTGADPDYPGSGDYGTAYGFRFVGLMGEKFDIVLDQYGDYYGHNRVGNWTPSENTDPLTWIGIHQLDPDPNDPSIYSPSVPLLNFNNLKNPYIDGKSLHFFIYSNADVYQEAIIPNFLECFICVDTTSSFDKGFTLLQRSDCYDSTIGLYIDIFRNDNGNNFSPVTVSNSIMGTGNQSCFARVYWANEWGNKSFSLPSFYGVAYASIRNGYIVYPSFNILGLLNGSPQYGNQVLYLHKLSYTPNPNPNPLPETPVPITSIPDDPEDPIPQSTPDPVPGIEYPVNPTPPPLRPVPSIVSGNDDLWPSVVELQNIEIDLSGYLSGLGDYNFPDLSVITESFAGSIVWVSALMSTLFNGSDFSILFAVLSSFFIVAALLGLYKWWNHK